MFSQSVIECFLETERGRRTMAEGPPGLVMFIAMYMDGMDTLDRNVHPWELYTEENKNVITGLVSRVRQNGQKGLDCYRHSFWIIMFECIMKRETIPADVREMILSKGHLP